MFSNLNRFLLVSKRTCMTGQFPDSVCFLILNLKQSWSTLKFAGQLIHFLCEEGAFTGVNSASVCVTWYVAWHQHLRNNMLWRQTYSLEFCARWWIIGSINPSNKFFVRTKQTNSLTWMILQLGCVQWKNVWPYTVVWLEIASFVDQTKMEVVRAIWSV